MVVVKSLLVLLLQNFLWTFIRTDHNVTCVLTKSCILPCSFHPGTEAVIHWMQLKKTNIPVHSYYKDKDQLEHQSENFRNRTSLFMDQISSGNASLLLTRLQVQDQGSYMCYTSTITGSDRESNINLQVEAPVREVNIKKVENSITCSSGGIYPKPQLTWSNMSLQEQPSIQTTELQLFSISSTVVLSNSDAEQVYTCTVSTPSSSRKTSWSTPTFISASNTEPIIHCGSSNTRPLQGLEWRFNQSEVVVTRTRGQSHFTVSEQWSSLVLNVSASGSLMLRHLSSAQTGLYTCVTRGNEETNMTNTFLTIEQSTAVASVTSVLIIVGILALLGVLVICIYKKKKCRKTQVTNQRESQQLHTSQNMPLRNEVEMNEFQSQETNNHEDRSGA